MIIRSALAVMRVSAVVVAAMVGGAAAAAVALGVAAGVGACLVGGVLGSASSSRTAGSMKVVEAAAEPLRVGLVGLGEAGNLGDDLILIATVDAVYGPTVQDVAFLSFGQELDWGQLAEDGSYRLLPRRVHAARIPLLRQNAWLYRDRDVIIFGGGGLLKPLTLSTVRTVG